MRSKTKVGQKTWMFVTGKMSRTAWKCTKFSLLLLYLTTACLVTSACAILLLIYLLLCNFKAGEPEQRRAAENILFEENNVDRSRTIDHPFWFYSGLLNFPITFSSISLLPYQTAEVLFVGSFNRVWEGLYRLVLQWTRTPKNSWHDLKTLDFTCKQVR